MNTITRSQSELAEILIAERLQLRESHAPLSAFISLNRLTAQLGPQDENQYAWLRFCGVPRIDATRLARPQELAS